MRRTERSVPGHLCLCTNGRDPQRAQREARDRYRVNPIAAEVDRAGRPEGSAARSLIGQAPFASTTVGRGPRSLAFVRGPAKDQPVPTVVRCRERRQDVAPG